jgi:hypothetical protein
VVSPAKKQNAVNMAKALLPFVADCDDLTNEDDVVCVMQALMRDIINTQNYQIQVMHRVLQQLNAPPTADCQVVIQKTELCGWDAFCYLSKFFQFSA